MACRNSACRRGLADATCSRLQNHTVWIEKLKNLTVQRSFSLVRYVMDRKTRNCVERLRRRQPISKIVRDDCDSIVPRKKLVQSLQLGRRKIKSDELTAGPSPFHQRKESSPATAHIENAPGINGHEFQ